MIVRIGGIKSKNITLILNWIRVFFIKRKWFKCYISDGVFIFELKNK